MKKPKAPEDDKTRLRGYIIEIADRIVESQKLHQENGKEPSLADLTEAARVLCQIYGLLEKTGDFQEGGTALNDYKRQFNQGSGRGSGKR